MKNLLAFLGWLFGLVFTVTGVVQFALGYFLPGLFLILAGLICFQSIRKKIFLKFGIKLSGDACFGIVVCLCLASIIQFATDSAQEIEQEEAIKLGFTSVAEYRADKALAASEACRKDLSCWSKKYRGSAEWLCRKSIERLANYSFIWTDNEFGARKFPTVAWADEEKGILTFYGDSIQFQNAFGALQNFIYFCDYDTVNERVVDAGAEPGRFKNKS